MDAKLLTEAPWKKLVQTHKLKDIGLQRALAQYETLPDDQYPGRLKAINTVKGLAEKLARVREVAAIEEVADYLHDLGEAVIAEQKQLQAAAAKAVAAARKEDAEKKKEEEAEEDLGDYSGRLNSALQKLKSSQGVAFEFLVCDAKPFCGVALAKKISTQHREELTRILGGSRRFLPVGTCEFAEGKYAFSLAQPPSGLAKKLQDAIKNFTGKKFAVVVGRESAEEDT